LAALLRARRQLERNAAFRPERNRRQRYDRPAVLQLQLQLQLQLEALRPQSPYIPDRSQREHAGQNAVEKHEWGILNPKAAGLLPRHRQPRFFLTFQRRFGQLDLGQPEIIDAFFEAFELLQLHRLVEVAIRREVVTLYDVTFKLGGGSRPESFSSNRLS
jgi:hypothetical protein